MSIATPAFAIVRPRVVVTSTGESRLLEEVVTEIVDEYGSGQVRLTGGPGSGKSTALDHLAAVFSFDDRMIFLDEPTSEQLEACPGESFVLAAMLPGGGRNLELALQPWGLDELIEYLLVKHHDACGSVIERLGPAARHRWLPDVATIVLDRFATDTSLSFPFDALMRHVDEQLNDSTQRLIAAEFCMAMVIGKASQIVPATAKLKEADFPPSVGKLLRHEIVQMPLAAERLLKLLSRCEVGVLESRLPWKFVKLVGQRCANARPMRRRLVKLLDTQFEKAHAMAASILLVADPEWRPHKGDTRWNFAQGIFRDAQWSEVNLAQAWLEASDFSDADLEASTLNEATLNGACFDRANLSRALVRATARYASFQGADLTEAKLNGAKLCGANFLEANLTQAELDGADLTAANLSAAVMQGASLVNALLNDAMLEHADLRDAVLRGANLKGVDLRRVALDRANMEEAHMNEVQLEDARIVGARLQSAKLVGALMTGSWLPAADFRHANLMGAKLAEIDWEGVDLRGANLRGTTFHMGSSRSGLVNSPYACEGSKTGFYTDDFEDLCFKRPEEIRKANLSNADLRGALAERVDFYLVDLRGAKLDPVLREQARASGAILENAIR